MRSMHYNLDRDRCFHIHQCQLLLGEIIVGLLSLSPPPPSSPPHTSVDGWVGLLIHLVTATGNYNLQEIMKKLIETVKERK